MPQSLSRVLIHLIFSTKNRVRLIKPSIQPELHRYLGGTLNKLDCPSIQVGGVDDHVHLFFGMNRTLAIADVVETVKTSSSKWMKTKGENYRAFRWQSGYAALSVSQSGADRVVTYIQRQPQHHQRISFQDEYRRFLKRYGIEFDERYVWD